MFARVGVCDTSFGDVFTLLYFQFTRSSLGYTKDTAVGVSRNTPMMTATLQKVGL